MPEYELSQRTPLRVWVLAAVCAVAVHLGCVALALEYVQPDDDVDLGAPAIEIGVALAAPLLDPTDLPPGPDTDESAFSPAVMAQEAVVTPTDLPKETPIETDDPDRLVALNDPQKPKQEDPETPAVPATPSLPSIAAEATATPVPDSVPEAPQSTAPAPGTGASSRRVRATWQKELAAHLDRFKRYPSDRSQQTAEIIMKFELDRTGHILSKSIARSSGDPSFDEAALAMMQRADPVPPPPPAVADAGLTFSMPVIFRVKGHN